MSTTHRTAVAADERDIVRTPQQAHCVAKAIEATPEREGLGAPPDKGGATPWGESNASDFQDERPLTHRHRQRGDDA